MHKILLVDDLPEFVQAEKELLDEYEVDCDIKTISNSELAIPMLENNRFDLVILDIMMPKKNGLDLLREIRSLSNIPVVVYTAYSHLYPPEQLLKMGASHVVTKPANVDILVKIIGELPKE